MPLDSRCPLLFKIDQPELGKLLALLPNRRCDKPSPHEQCNMDTNRNYNGEFAVILLNEQGTILDAHPSCAEAFGWGETELAGQDVSELLEYGRELLMQQLVQLQDSDAESGGHTSFSIRVMARRRDKSRFRARVTVRRFPRLDCWTAAFYRLGTDADEAATPVVRMEEIVLATARQEQTTGCSIAQRLLHRT